MAQLSEGALIGICLSFLVSVSLCLWYKQTVYDNKRKRSLAATHPSSLLRSAVESRDPEQPPQLPLGEAYTVEGPTQEVRLAYHQELPPHIIEQQGGPPSSSLVRVGPDVARATDAISSNPAYASHSGTNVNTATLSPNQTTVAILTLQEEVQRLRSQASHQTNPVPPSQNPFLTPPIPMERSQSRGSDGPGPQEQAVRRRLEALEAEVARLQSDNAVLILASMGPSSPPAYQPRERNL